MSDEEYVPGIAVYAPQIQEYDYLAMESTIVGFDGAPAYQVPSGFGMQGAIGLLLYMRNPKSLIRVYVPPDQALVNPWWEAVPERRQRVKVISVRGNDQAAIAKGVLYKAKELVAFCEFDEYLMESDSGENAQSWRMVEYMRKRGRPVATHVLKSKEESSKITRSIFTS